jgi:hypothetical protein
LVAVEGPHTEDLKQYRARMGKLVVSGPL